MPLSTSRAPAWPPAPWRSCTWVSLRGESDSRPSSDSLPFAQILVSSRRSRRVSTSRTPGWSCATPTVARPGCSPSHWRRASLPHSRRGWPPGKHRPLPRWPVHLSPIYLTFPPLCPVRGDAARSTETSVTSGEQPAAISGTSAATNTFQTRKARTGNPGSPELRHQHHHIDRDSSRRLCLLKISFPRANAKPAQQQPEWAERSASEHSGFNAVRVRNVTRQQPHLWPLKKQRAIRNWNWIRIQLIQKFSHSCGKQ